MWWMIVYTAGGVLVGEIYLTGCQKTKVKPDWITYLLGMSTWPLVTVLTIYAAWRQS